MFHSSNPALKPFDRVNAPTWDQLGNQGSAVGFLDKPATDSASMTVTGTTVKTGVLLAICLVGAVLSYAGVESQSQLSLPIALGGMLVGAITGLIIGFRPKTAPYLAHIYAAAEGSFLGAISYFIATRAGLGVGIIFQALLMTFGILASALILYASGILRPGRTFFAMIMAGTIGVSLAYLAVFIAGMFGVNIPFLHDAVRGSGALGIGFSVFAVLMASGTLVLDIQAVHQGVEGRAPKYMEWYGGFALLASLVWLYIEILRLLAKLRRD